MNAEPERPPHDPDPAAGERTTLRELALVFLRLGLISFGGPAAHIALMEDELVSRRNWLTRGEFLDLLGAVNLIPGPNSTEMAIHIGRVRRGFLGLLVAGGCFIGPAVFLTAGLAWLYMRYGSLPQVESLLYGIKPAVIAIIIQALYRLAPAALKDPIIAVAALTAAALSLAGVHELLVIFGMGLAVAIANSMRRGGAGGGPPIAGVLPLVPGLPGILGLGAAASGAAASSLPALFLVFLKIGSVLFGSGYVLLAFLRRDLVERLGWLSESQLLDAVAAGQATPGPVFSTATFIGYMLGGPSGAALATAGIFLPAFFFVALSAPLLPRLRRSRFLGKALDGINAASLALMAIVAFQLGRAALVDAPAWIFFLASAILAIGLRVNSAWIILGSGVAGLVIRQLS